MTATRSFDQYLQQQLEDPEKRAAYEDYEARRALVGQLVARRKDLGVTQGQVAARMGVKQPTVSGFENEDTDPRLSTIYRYARAVDACLSTYLDFKGTDGGWKREVWHRAWRPTGTYHTFENFYGPESECEVISLNVARKWERAVGKIAASG